MSVGDTTGLGRDVSDDGTAEFDSARVQVGGASVRGSLQHISWFSLGQRLQHGP